MDYKAVLFEMIKGFVTGKIPSPQFMKRYYDFYIDEVPDNYLSDKDSSLFSSIQEKIDFVDSSPDAQSRSAGFIDYSEFRNWVANKFKIE